MRRMKYLHTMIRVRDLDAALAFFGVLGLQEVRRSEVPAGRFTLVFLATAPGEPEVELTYNWDQQEPYSVGRSFGHLAYAVDDIYAACERWGLSYVPSDANFVLVDAGDRREALLAGLEARNIYIRDRHRQPGCAGCVRITTGLVAHTEACIDAIEEILCGKA